MLSAELNRILTRVGPEAPIGALFRRFWLPALLSEEIPGPDCPPVRVTLLGTGMVAFRDSQGAVGLLDARCPHRLTDLFFGRNEQGGLRCVYHGWKFDVQGACLEMPSEPPGSRMKENIRVNAYPVVEKGGIVWAYLGPRDRLPELPDLEFLSLQADHFYVSKCLMKCNFQQALEGSIDTAHLTFLHRSLEPMAKDVFAVGDLQQFGDADGAPRFFCKDTDYGLQIAAQRNAEEDSFYWRITQWFMPTYVLVPTVPGLVCRANLFIPIDDENCWWYRVRYHPDRPLSGEELAEYSSGGLDYARLIPGTYIPEGGKANDYLLNRNDQRGSSFTGIPSAQLQDIAVQEGQGAIVDRTQEHLGTTDAAISRCRRRLIDAAKALEEGTEPVAASNGSLYRLRAVAMELPREAEPEEAARRHLVVQS